jgi:MtN3 and saliva related transmembrane protein
MDPATLVNILGTAAGLFSMASFVPQVVKIWRDKRAAGVALHTYLLTVTGFVLWIVYGVMLKSWPVAASNSVNLVLSGAILALRWRYGDGEDAAASTRADPDTKRASR